MQRARGWVAAFVVLAGAGCVHWAREPNFGTLAFDERPFEFAHDIELFAMPNGMRVALIQDDTTNIATVDLRLDVGAAEDPEGRAGMAHLVEHMLFQLRATPDGPTFADELQQLTLHHNAATSWDFTHFTEAMPIENLDAVLALEGRRMRASCDQIEEAVLRREIDVVRQEDRQRHTALDSVRRMLLADVFGARHPYSRPIGSDEITAITREELCAFIERHYAPNRAHLVVTGAFTPEAMRAVVGRTFGPVTRRAAPRAPAPAAILAGGESRHPAPIERPAAVVFLPYPAWGGDSVVVWDIARAALAAEMQRAKADRAWITATTVGVVGGERQRVMAVFVEVASAAHLDAAVDEVFTRVRELESPYSHRSMYQLVSRMRLGYIEGWDRRLGRGEWIARFMHHTNHDRFMSKELQGLHTTDLRKALPAIAQKLVRAGSHVSYLTPSGTPTSTLTAAVPTTSHDVAPWRTTVDPAEADRPVEIGGTAPGGAIETYELANGLAVQLAPDRASRIVDVRIVFPGGSAHEPADRPYLAYAAATMLEADFESVHEAKWARRLQWALERDTVIDVDVDRTATTFVARGSATWGDWHLWLLSWWLGHGTYNASTVAATRRAADDLDEETVDDPAVRRAVAERLFGVDHPYARPSPLGASLLRIDRAELVGWKDAHFRARGATLIVSGGFDPAVMKKHIDELFGPWPGEAPPSLPDVRRTEPAPEPSWFAIEAPGALQTTLWIGHPTRPDAGDDEASRAVLEAMIEDELRDLREGMGATYALDVTYRSDPAGGAVSVSADVAASHAPEAAARMLAVLDRFAAHGGEQREAFVRARKQVLGYALARLGGATAVASQLAAAAAQGHGPARARWIANRLAELRPADVARVAAADLDPARRIVVVQGTPASVDAVFQRIGAKPTMRLDAGERRTVDERRDAAPDGASARGPRGDAELFLGDDHLKDGHEDGALYLGQRELTLDEFLAIAGAEDVRSRMRTRRWGRRGILLGGVVAIAAGATIALTAEPCSSQVSPAENRACERDRSQQRSFGAIVAAIGAVTMLTSTQVGKGAPSEHELRAMARRYNRRPVAVTPVACPDGAGVMISGGF